MSSTDDRIVKMQFDNAQFKRAAGETQKSLSDLNKAVDLAGKGKGLMDLDGQMQKIGVTASKMQIATTTALATIANKATNVALGLANSLTLNPIRSGFSEYEALLTKQNTIMNSTGKSAAEVKKTLAELNHFSDQTIYSFSNMTDAVTKFTNAGVPLDRAVMSIKGIANAAAFAGASSEEAGRAMIGFSQAIGTGFMGLMDWTQIENANMGTVRFKEQLLEAAVAAGTLTKKGNEYITGAGNATSATKGWRDALQDQWLTAEVLNSTLAKYTDRSTKLGRQAIQSAKEVRTFSAFMDTLKESIGSGWASIFQSLFGNLNQSTKLWTGVSDAVGSVVQGFFGFLSTSLKTWRQMGGFQKTMEGFSNLLAPFKALVVAIGDAWRAAFPNTGAGSGKALYGLSAAFAAITTPLRWLAELISGAVGPLTFFFKVIRLGGEIVKNVVGYFADFVKNALGLIDLKAPSTGGLLEWLKDVAIAAGNAVDKISDMLAKGASIKEAFTSVSFPKRLFDQAMPSMPDIGSIFSGGGDKAAGGAAAGVTAMAAPLGAVGGIAERAKNAFSSLSDVATEAGEDVQKAGTSVGEALKVAWGWIEKFVSGINWDDVIASFNIAVLSAFLIRFAQFLNSMKNVFGGVGEVMGGLGSMFTDFGQAATRNAWANLFIKLALSLLVLAAAMWVLSKIPYDRLASGFVVLFGLFRLITTTMGSLTKTLTKMEGAKSSLKIIAVAMAIGILAAALVLLALAMLIYNKIDLMSVVKGTVVMFAVMKAMEMLGKAAKDNAKGIIAGAFAVGMMAGAMIVLAGALMLFKFVDWGSMLKAGLVLGAVALAVGLVAKLPAPALFGVAAAMMSVSFGMVALAFALLMFQLVKWESIGKLAVVLAALAISLGVMMALGGPVAVSGMFGLGLGLMAIAAAALIMNKVNWSSIAKVGVVLLVLIAAFAAFMAVVTVFAPVIILLSLFAGSLAALAGALALLGLAFAVIFPLLAAGTAAFAALGTGAAIAIAVFVQTLAAEAPILKKAVLDMMQVFFDGIVESIPIVVDGIKRIWEALKKEFTNPAGDKEAGKAGSSMVMSMAGGVEKKKKPLIDKAIDLLLGFIGALAKRGAELSAAGTNLIVQLIRGIASKAGDIVDAGFELMLKILQGIGEGLSGLVEGAIKIFIQFLHDLADAIRNGSRGIGEGLADVAGAMVTVGFNIIAGLVKGIKDSAGDVIDAIKEYVTDKLPGFVKKALGISSPSKVFMEIGKFIVQGLTEGIQNHAVEAIRAVASMVSGQIATASAYISKFVQKLDQDAIAARAKADGLASAAEKAAKAAEKTKSKKDDKAANKLYEQAEKAAEKADKAETRAEKAKEKAEREEEFQDSTLLEKAQMRSEDAASELDAAKEAERRAAAAVVEANALEKQAKQKGVTKKQKKKLLEEAERLRKQAAEDAREANQHIENAKKNAGEALAYQKLAGDEAAKAFQEAFESDAKKAAEEEAFNKLTDAEKAEVRKQQAAELQAQAEKDLAEAKRLAYIDLDAANLLAKKAQDEAAKARDYLKEAADLATGVGAGGGAVGTVVNTEITDAAAIAMGKYNDLYSSAYAAAAGGKSYEFNQYNTSPEALSPTEIYRQGRNLFAFAVEKIDADSTP